MDRRLQLHELLKTFCPNVYFQPPDNVTMVYPAIRYGQDDEDALFAGNRPYRRHKRYQVTVIDRKPDSDIPDKVADLPLTSFSRAYVAENLNHTVFTTYF